MKMNENLPKIICLMGPTAAGKTELAIELVQRMPSEIISVDSAMIYRGMDIGTGKPSSRELIKAPHHLINIKDPSEPYSAAEFVKDALSLISDIHNRGKIPILVGGTMLYFHALEHGLSPLPSSNPNIREKISEDALKFGWEAMHQRLATIDPTAAKRIHKNDPQRISRALEVYEISGQSMSSYFEEKETNNLPLKNIQSHKFALIPQNRSLLHQRIEKRFNKMLDEGLLIEVEKLQKRGDLHLNLPSMRAVGYRQILSYLNQEISFEEMVTKTIAATRQLAKRQLTWLRNSSNITNLEVENNHLDSLKTMVNSLRKPGTLVFCNNNPV